MCCSTGLCGPDPDEALVQFASDLRALAAEGVPVVRHNLAQEPEAFMAEPAVVQAINALGTSVLPMIVRGGVVLSHSRYPSLSELRALCASDALVPLGLAPAPTCAPGGDCC